MHTFPLFCGRALLPLLAVLFAAVPAAAQDFGAPVAVSNVIRPSGDGADGTVSVARDGDIVVAAWGSEEPLESGAGPDYDIHFARSTDGGATWTDPAPLNSNFATDTGFDNAPRLATDGNIWIAVWRSNDSFGGTTGTDFDILFSRSTDDGVTWSPVQVLNSTAYTDDDTLESDPNVAMDASGHVVVLWSSNSTLGGTTGTDFDILVSRSSDFGLSWSAVQALNSDAAGDTSTSDMYPELRTDGAGNWIGVWTRRGGGVLSDGDIAFARSTDNGATWTAPSIVNTDFSVDDRGDDAAEIALDATGAAVVVWTAYGASGSPFGSDTDILFARSTDGGASWSAPSAVNSYALTDSGTNGTDSWPHVSTDANGRWIATWTSNWDDVGATYVAEIRFATSDDGGATWSNAGFLTHGDEDVGSEYDACLTHDGAGKWLALWWSYDTLGGRLGPDTDILSAHSDDDGSTWSEAGWVNSNAPADGFDSSPSVASDGSVWIAVWESDDSLGGTIDRDLDILFARSTDGGASWSEPAAIDSGAGADLGAERAPQIATDGSSWVVAWYTYNGAIVFARSTDAGLSWSIPQTLTSSGIAFGQFVSVAADAAGFVIAWTSYQELGGTLGNDTDILYSRSTDGGASWSPLAVLNTNAAADTGMDTSARLQSDGARWIAVWASSENLSGSGGEGDIVFATSDDGAATWSAPATLNTNASSDAGIDELPRIASAGGTTWVAVWVSGDSLGGTIGTDKDIVFARSTDGGASWSAPQALSANAASDSGADEAVDLACDATGSCIALALTKDSFGGTIGTDGDLVLVRSSDGGASWSVSEPLLETADEDSGLDHMPAVATDGLGGWAALFVSRDALAGLNNAGRFNVFAVSAGGCGACDDGNPCTQDVCNDGACTHFDGPTLDCRLGTKASLVVKNGSDPAKHALQWKMSGAQSTSQAELADPTATADYVLCVYDAAGAQVEQTIEGGGSCNGAACWSAISTKGYKYKDAAGTSGGVTSVLLKGSTKNKTKAQLKASGASAPVPALPLSGSVAVQLHDTQTGTCLGAVFGAGDITANDGDAGLFQAKLK